jgi:hypothetical protein
MMRMLSPLCLGASSIWTSSDADVLRKIAVSSSRRAQTGTMSTTVGFLVRTLSTEQDARLLCCPDCKLLLNLIQPDESQPTRLLGTCDVCSKWFFLLELEPDWRKTVMVEIPSGEALQQAIAEAKALASGQRGTGP